MVLKAKRLKVSYSGSQSLSQNEKDEQPKLFVLPARLLLFLIIHLYEKEAEAVSFFCEDRTIEMFLRFRCLDLNTRHNHSTSLRFCFQGCLQRHLDFRAADKDHLDFLFLFHHYAFNNLSESDIIRIIITTAGSGIN